MGRPRELSEKDIEKLRTHGYRPVEVWVQDLDANTQAAETWRQSARKAAAADEREGINETLSQLLDSLLEHDD